MILRKRNKSILIIYSGLDGLINRISSDQRTVFVICFYDFKILVNVEQRWASDHPDIVDMKQTKHGRLISLNTKAYVVETMTIKKIFYACCNRSFQFTKYCEITDAVIDLKFGPADKASSYVCWLTSDR